MNSSPPPSPDCPNVFIVSLSAGAAAFGATASVILCKTLLVRVGATPVIDYGGVSALFWPTVQNLLLTPGFVAVLVAMSAATALIYRRLTAGSRWETITSYSIFGAAFAFGLAPFAGDGTPTSILPLVVVLPLMATLALMATQPSLSLSPAIIFTAALPAGYIFFHLTDLLADTGVAAAFPITWDFVRKYFLATATFVIALKIGFFLPFILGVRILSPAARPTAVGRAANLACAGLGVWLIVFVDYLLERLDAFPALMNFRFGLEGFAFLLIIPAARDFIGVGRRQALFLIIALGASVASIFVPLTPKATLYSTGLSIDAEIKRLYSKLLDRDGDGASVYFGEGDCNDRDFNIRPGRSDIPLNGVDENCLAGDLMVADAAPPQWILSKAGQNKRKIILLIIDTLRSDLVFGDTPAMAHLNAFAKRHAGFANAYPMGGVTASSLLNLFYPEPVLSQVAAKQKNLLDYLREAGYRSHCVHGSHRPSSSSITVNIMNRCNALDVVAAHDLMAIPSGETVLEHAMRLVEGAPENSFFWIHLDDIHDYTIYRPGAGYQTRFLFDLVPRLTSYVRLNRYLRDKYLERAAYLDGVLERLVLNRLTLDPRFADSLFIVTGDHGEEFLEHDGIFHGATLYEEAIKVPIVVKDGLGGGIETRPVTHRDLVHTLMEFIGFERGPVGAQPLRTLVPDRVIVQLLENTGLIAVRQGRYKSILNYRNNAQLLFDLEKDPHETVDLSMTHPEIAARLAKLIDYEARQIIKR